MFIETVDIKNFQSHKETTINLGKGINVFVGTSDSGKSAILRAIKWCLNNQPSGDEFIKEGERETTVTVGFSDGHRITRSRSKGGSKNTYALYKGDLLLNEYTGFGLKVPPDILEVTQMNPDLEFNFASQLEAPFLLSETPRVRAETIGSLEELGKIDTELTKVNEDIRYEKKNERELKSELEELDKKRSKMLVELEKDRKKVDTLNFLKKAITEKSTLLNSVDKLYPRLEELQVEFEHLTKEVEVSKRILLNWDDSLTDEIDKVEKLSRLVDRLKEVRSDVGGIEYMNAEKINALESLTNKVTELVAVYQKLNQHSMRLSEIAKEESITKEGFSERVSTMNYDTLDSDVEKYAMIFKNHKHLTEIQKDKESMVSKIESFGVEVERLLNEFVEALKVHEVCPTCFQETHDVEKEIIEKSL